MSRIWTQIAGVPIDIVGFGLLVLLSLAAAWLVGAAWHFFPGWLPRRSWLAGIGRARLRSSDLRRMWRWRGPRSKRDARTAVTRPGPIVPPPEALPDLPVEQFISLADQHAAAGRFREAVRERLRAIVRGLVDRGVIANHPEWTVTELVRAAGAAAPRMQGDLTEASAIFSDIWYGEHQARQAHDERMRQLVAAIGGDQAVRA